MKLTRLVMPVLACVLIQSLLGASASAQLERMVFEQSFGPIPVSGGLLMPFADDVAGSSTLERLRLKGLVERVELDWKMAAESDPEAGPKPFCRATMMFDLDGMLTRVDTQMGGDEQRRRSLVFDNTTAEVRGRRRPQSVVMRQMVDGEAAEQQQTFTTTFEYDEMGNLKTLTERSESGATTERRIERNEAGDIVSVRISERGDPLVVSYDASGRQTEFGKGDNSISMQAQWTEKREVMYSGRSAERGITTVAFDKHRSITMWKGAPLGRPLEARYAYDYDRQGNWTRLRIRLLGADRDGKAIDFVMMDVSRKIIYRK